jgi:hypothetical protein
MAAVYVPIVRYFRDLTDDPQSATTRRMRRRINPEHGVDWASLLGASPDEKRPIVLIAPSGTGKSTEMREEARRRAAAGESAIFAPAASVVDGVAGRLGADASRVFQEWSTGSRTLLFFIDAVDELWPKERVLATSTNSWPR